MAKKIRPLDLTKAVEEIYEKYGDQVNDVVTEAVESVAEDARDELRSVSKFNPSRDPSGDYSRDWEVKAKEVKRYAKEMVVYNETHYQLTHLLEFGHAVKRGGRKVGEARAYPHIAPINDKAQEEVIREIEERIGNL